MQLNYSLKYLRRNLLFSLPFLTIVVIKLYNGTFTGTSFLFLAAALVPLIAYFLGRKYPYAIIEGDVLSKNPLAPKGINLREVDYIEKYAGNYIFRTQNDKLILDTTIMRPNDLLALNEEIHRRSLFLGTASQSKANDLEK